MMAMAAPRPKSPPSSDPCGRHRLQHAVDTLQREIGFLELWSDWQKNHTGRAVSSGEINSIEGVHAASRCCKEVDEFIVKNTDPFITISSKKGNTDQSHHFLKKFRARTCLSYLSWICCCDGCSSSFQHKGPLRCSSSCCSRGTLERLCCCCSGCRPCRLSCWGCSCTSPCPRITCGCTCSCPRCFCICPASCNAACCCVVPRCYLCL